MRHQNYKNENTETKYLNNIWENKILKVKNSLLELKDREIRDREIEIKKATEKPFSC